METPETIAAALWAERDEYPQLHDEEFESERALLGQVKHEMNAMNSFKDLSGARDFFEELNDAAEGAGKK